MRSRGAQEAGYTLLEAWYVGRHLDESLIKFSYHGVPFGGGATAAQNTRADGVKLQSMIALREVQGRSEVALVAAEPHVQASRLFMRSSEFASLFAGVEP